MSTTESPQFVPWKNLGTSGLKISNVILGFMGYGSKDWYEWVEDDEDKIFNILKKAYDLGIRTYDTADVYSNGLSEIILGKFLKKYNIKRDKVVILTKVFAPVDDQEYPPGKFLVYPGDWSPADAVNLANNCGLSRRHILDAAENSVRRLGTYIDVYQIHRFDPSTPEEETMRALNDVVDKGLARYIGASSMKAVDFVQLQHVAEIHGWHKFISVQSFYNLLNREDENELNYYANKTGVGIIPWSPLAGGILARPPPKEGGSTLREKVSTGGFAVRLDEGTKDADIEILERVGEIASKRNVSRAAVATAWSISKGAAPIVGISSESRLDDLFVGSAILHLTEDEIKYLEEPYRPKARRAV